MLDLKYINNNLQFVAKKLATRGYKFNIDEFIIKNKEIKYLKAKSYNLQSKRNAISQKISQKINNKNINNIFLKVKKINQELKIIKKNIQTLQNFINQILLSMPNIPDNDVPTGTNKNDNIEIKKWGTPRIFNPKYPPKNHVEICKNINMIDINSAVKITGTRFIILKNKIAKLHRALSQFMLDIHTEQHNYEELYVPYLVNNDSLYGTGQLPKFNNDIFQINGNFSYNLIPTGEVPITNIIRNKILNTESLPKYYVAHTPCFRKEAGTYGHKNKGIFRQHQFEKVELVHITTADNGNKSLQLLISHAEKILQKLNLPYRLMKLCTGDMNFSAKKTYDLEVWIPSQNNYIEISSCSWCGDFQARRMKARHKNSNIRKPELVHTLNGSGLAIGRTLLAIIENYQQNDGSIIIPNALINYMNGISIIK